MSPGVMLAVLGAAFLNAAWNTSVKAVPDKFLAVCLICFGAAIVSLPIALCLPPIRPDAYPFLLLSTLFQVAYYLLVNRAYRTADLSMAYPLMRGAAPLMTMVLAFLLIGEVPKMLGLGGAVLILAGIVWLARSGIRAGGLDRQTLIAVVANALVIAGYSMADGQGGRLSGLPIAYTLWVMTSVGVAFVPVALYFRGPQFVRDLRHEWRFALLGGGASTLAYGIVVWAMSHAPIGLVSATRETSALFASVLGAVLLKEKFGFSRYIAAALVVCGLAVMRLA
eukprot:gene16276-16455_t